MTEPKTNTFELSGLEHSRIDLLNADVTIGSLEENGSPKLIIEGDIPHTYEDGVLSVTQAAEADSDGKVTLLLPKDAGDGIGQEIRTKDGNVTIEGVETEMGVNVVTGAGNLAVKNSKIGIGAFGSETGNVTIEGVNSIMNVAAHSDKGNVVVEGGEAPYWRVTSRSGDIAAHPNKGAIGAESVMGTVLTS